jgi:hypothetical protein
MANIIQEKSMKKKSFSQILKMGGITSLFHQYRAQGQSSAYDALGRVTAVACCCVIRPACVKWDGS